MSDVVPDELLEQARRLDAEAIRVGEEGAHGRALRAQAAALRVEAIGARVYPVLVCAACFRISGWTGDGGRCDLCLRHEALRARSGAVGWPSQPAAVYPGPKPSPPLPLAARLAAGLGSRARLERALAFRWLERVEPAQTGPIDPEQGFELDLALRDEIERVDGAGLLVRFATASHRFGPEGWERLPSSRVGRSSLPNPAEFSAELPIEQLAAAWVDYRAALEEINRRRWAAEEARREQERQTVEARRRLLREQAHTAELLEE